MALAISKSIEAQLDTESLFIPSLRKQFDTSD